MVQLVESCFGVAAENRHKLRLELQYATKEISVPVKPIEDGPNRPCVIDFLLGHFIGWHVSPFVGVNYPAPDVVEDHPGFVCEGERFKGNLQFLLLNLFALPLSK